MIQTPQNVLKFWFEETPAELRFKRDDAFDAKIRERFAATLEAAAKGELYKWRDAIEGRLAEVIVLDQFSRNLYRGTARSFAQDPMSLALSQEAIRTGAHQKLNGTQKQFLYMPFMHSESLAIHAVGKDLYAEEGVQGYDYEIKHAKIIERFGRYPHRNEVLGRTSTPEEIAFLKEPGSSF